MLQATASVILPRLTGLTKAYLLYHNQVGFQVVTHIPSVEKVVIQHGDKLLDGFHSSVKRYFCMPSTETSIFTTLVPPKNLEKYANEVGKSLTKMPSISITTKVLCQKIKNAIIKTSKTVDREQSQFSDVET
ncbi:hypothetical protein Clacol_006884 [Clathrus columnatus]|uniref:Uncharacterized protein n=1 Tax=Clathrus columnatus TaxID=1419009 RepID=A0AAV5AI69_9AGAM|nr:hypothetical protein Clacol_006884 [Clathrus columnatus]